MPRSPASVCRRRGTSVGSAVAVEPLISSFISCSGSFLCRGNGGQRVEMQTGSGRDADRFSLAGITDFIAFGPDTCVRCVMEKPQVGFHTTKKKKKKVGANHDANHWVHLTQWWANVLKGGSLMGCEIRQQGDGAAADVWSVSVSHLVVGGKNLYIMGCVAICALKSTENEPKQKPPTVFSSRL